jgi:Trp operon repressor
MVESPSESPRESPPQTPPAQDLSNLTSEELTKLKLLKILYEAREEQHQLTRKNKEYQRQLSEYFRSQKVKNMFNCMLTRSQMDELPLERTTADQDKFIQILQELDNTAEELRNVQSEYDTSVQEMKNRLGTAQI